MAKCFCRWRNLLICLCTPCILLVLLFVYIVVMVYMAIPQTAGPQSAVKHFIAQGTYRNEGWAPLPKTFWDLNPSLGIWNLLQLTTDRSLNPILRPRHHTRRLYRGNNISNKSLLAEGSSGAQDPVRKLGGLADLPAGIQEFVRHMHRRDYPVVIEPHDACGAGTKGDDDDLLLLAIKTTVMNLRNRQTIRNTWGRVGWVDGQRRHSGGYVRRVFLLGTADDQEYDMDTSTLLQMEGRQFGDILQWDFKDTFFNLTLKDVLFWEWFSRRCQRTRFVFKGDDDIFLNTPALVDYLQQLGGPGTPGAPMRSFMVGDVIGAAQPNRVNDSKYFVPEAFYRGVYPPYAGGGGVVYSGLLTKHLHGVSKRVHLYPIDDVYVGMCLLRLNAYPSHHRAFLTFDFPKDEEMELCAYHRIILVHKRTPKRVAQLWKQLKERQPLCWNASLRGSEEETLNVKV